MRKGSHLSSGTDKLLDAFIQTLNSLSTKIIFSDIKFNVQTWNTIFGSLGNMDDNKTRLFGNNNEAHCIYNFSLAPLVILSIN